MTAPLEPGQAIGIVGGGQLGRMLALAAARLGLRTCVLCPDTDAPAAQVATHHIAADYTDAAALAILAGHVGAATYEFENIPAASVAQLAQTVPVYPGVRALEVAQDRLTEKSFLNEHGIATAPFAAVDSDADLAGAAEALGLPAVLKTRRFGYDGKGQVMLKAAADLSGARAALHDQPAILEGFVRFEREVSVIAARGRDGRVAAYDVAENVHRNHVLARSTVPAAIPPALAAEAARMAGTVLDALDYVGVLGLELFHTRDPKTGAEHLLANEIAPRVHNSGHWTLEACAVSQFEQHVRAVAGWPLGDPARHSDAVMDNLLGQEAASAADLLAEPGASLHLYGKGEMRPGRKMGHVTRLSPRSPGV